MKKTKLGGFPGESQKGRKDVYSKGREFEGSCKKS